VKREAARHYPRAQDGACDIRNGVAFRHGVKIEL